MSAFFKAFAGLLLVLMLAFGYEYSGIISKHSVPKEVKKEWKEDVAPDVDINLIDGTTKKLSSYSDKIILLNFWATWCPPCLEEFPVMLKLAKKYPDKIVLVAVSNDLELATIKKFLKRYNIKNKVNFDQENIHIAWDKTYKISRDAFNVIRLPETFILQNNLTIIRKVVGSQEWLSGDIDPYIRDL